MVERSPAVVKPGLEEYGLGSGLEAGKLENYSCLQFPSFSLDDVQVA